MGGGGRSWIEGTIWGGVTVFVREDFRSVAVDPATGGLGTAQLKQRERISRKDRELQGNIGRLEGWRRGRKTKKGNLPAVLPIFPTTLLFRRFCTPVQPFWTSNLNTNVVSMSVNSLWTLGTMIRKFEDSTLRL